MATVRISDPDLRDVLVEDLGRQGDVLVAVRGEDRLEVSILGSLNLEAMRLAIYLRVRAWEAGQRAQGHDVTVDLS